MGQGAQGDAGAPASSLRGRGVQWERRVGCEQAGITRATLQLEGQEGLRVNQCGSQWRLKRGVDGRGGPAVPAQQAHRGARTTAHRVLRAPGPWAPGTSAGRSIRIHKIHAVPPGVGT